MLEDCTERFECVPVKDIGYLFSMHDLQVLYCEFDVPDRSFANFHLSPRSGRAEVSTRIRLGDSQTIVAVAQFSDGTFWSDQAELVVTLPACVEG